jgi:hypothetical protein
MNQKFSEDYDVYGLESSSNYGLDISEYIRRGDEHKQYGSRIG